MEKAIKTTGLIFIISGLLAVIFPHIAGLAIEVIYGFLIAGIGLFYLITVMQSKFLPGRIGQAALAVMFLIAGLLMIFMPMKGLMAFTLIIAWLFIMQGVVQTVSAFSLDANRVWTFLSAAISIAAGTLILTEWPTSANWLVGLLIGINLIVTGLVITKGASIISGVTRVRG